MSGTDELPDEGEAGRARVRKSATAFRTISEVADELHIPQHVLRFWETKFPQVRPLKRGGGRRYYRPDDLALLRRISDLLYIQGYTIKGVQRLLRETQGRLGEASADEQAEVEAFEDEANEDAGPPDASLEGEADPLHVAIPAAPDAADEIARLRAALLDTLAALETLRAMLP